MIKFRLYSSDQSESKMAEMINKLSSVALGNFIFKEEEGGRSIQCLVSDDVNDYGFRRLILDENNVWEVNRYRHRLPDFPEPTKSYLLALSELIDALDDKGYKDGIEFINKLSKSKNND